MKKLIFAGLCLLAGVLVTNAYAEGEVACIIRTNPGNPTDTQQMTDGGAVCTWGAGATVAAQCPNARVCYDPAVKDRQADGGLQKYSDAGIIGPQATLNDLCIDFRDSVGNPDPVFISLNPGEKNIGIVAENIGDGGAYVDCRFALTPRKAASR